MFDEVYLVFVDNGRCTRVQASQLCTKYTDTKREVADAKGSGSLLVSRSFVRSWLESENRATDLVPTFRNYNGS